MRRNLVALLGTLSALVLLFGYHTSLNSSGPATAATAPLTPGTPAPTTGSSGSGSGSDSGSSKKSTSGSSAKTYTVLVAETRWGPVLVQIAFDNGKITAAQPIQVPNGNFRDQEINSYAVPMLNQEAVQAQSAQIDAISGATVTSDGYIQSLQSAIDQAHL
jgi:uncharacterized protein with FMN-binding domain